MEMPTVKTLYINRGTRVFRDNVFIVLVKTSENA